MTERTLSELSVAPVQTCADTRLAEDVFPSTCSGTETLDPAAEVPTEQARAVILFAEDVDFRRS